MSEETPAPKILMIDDETNSRRMATLLLEREGYQIQTAPNGAEGLILAKVGRPQVIMLDIMMPEMNGHEVLRRLKADPDTKQIPVIVITARGTERDMAASFRLGAVFHVEKPYETKDLLHKIQMALALGIQEGVDRPGVPEEGAT